MKASESGRALSDDKRCAGCFSCNPHWSHLLLIAIIAVLSIAVSLVLLPHFLTNEQFSMDEDPFSCSPTLYTGSTCLSQLRGWQSCLPERQNTNTSSTEVLVPSDINQELAESQAETLFAGVQLVGASRECQVEFQQFWCLLLFGVCDGENQRRLPSFDLCTSLQTDTCSDLVQIAATVPQYKALIQNCNNFRFSQPPPCRNESEGNETRVFNVTCSSRFYYDESELICKPICGEWTHLSPEVDTAIRAMTATAGLFSVIICLIVLVLALVQYKKIFTFPSVLMVYATLTVLVVVINDLLSDLSSNSPLCSSIDLIENYGGNTSVYCKVQVSLFLYAILVISLLWLFQTGAYFWGVLYPLHYRSVITSGKLKFVHAIVVIASFALPVIPLLPAHTENGIGINVFVPRKCTLLNSDLLVYGFITPIVVIVIFGVSLLVITAWSVGNVSGHFRKTASGSPRLKSTEVKLISMIIAYLLLGFYTTLSATISMRNFENHARALGDHFACEGLGDDTMECSREGFGSLVWDSFIQTFVYIAFSLYPSIFFMFLISREHFRKLCGKPTEPTSSSSNI